MQSQIGSLVRHFPVAFQFSPFLLSCCFQWKKFSKHQGRLERTNNETVIPFTRLHKITIQSDSCALYGFPAFHSRSRDKPKRQQRTISEDGRSVCLSSLSILTEPVYWRQFFRNTSFVIIQKLNTFISPPPANMHLTSSSEVKSNLNSQAAIWVLREKTWEHCGGSGPHSGRMRKTNLAQNFSHDPWVTSSVRQIKSNFKDSNVVFDLSDASSNVIVVPVAVVYDGIFRHDRLIILEKIITRLMLFFEGTQDSGYIEKTEFFGREHVGWCWQYLVIYYQLGAGVPVSVRQIGWKGGN